MANVTGVNVDGRAIKNELLISLCDKVNLPLIKLPRDLQAVVRKYIPLWSSMTAGERATKIRHIDKQREVKLRIKFSRAEKASALAQDSPEYERWLEIYRRISAKERELLTEKGFASDKSSEAKSRHVNLQRLSSELEELRRERDAMPTAQKPTSILRVNGHEWQKKAQDRAVEIIERQRKKDLYPSQIDIADEIAKEFRRPGVEIVGADGKPLSGAYIKRHALRGISSAKGKQLSTRTGRGK
jgi:hypothetical protein